MIAAELDASAVIASLENLVAKSPEAIHAAEMDTALEGMRLSQMEVPHDEGTLQNSGTVEDLPNGDIIIGYHTPYAARMHEHPEYRFQKGRKGKYLEDPIINNTAQLNLVFGRGIQTRLF
jgi:hypothetical protein